MCLCSAVRRCADERNAGVYNEYDDKIDHPVRQEEH